MKYQFKISKFIQDVDIQKMPDKVLIETFRSAWIYKLQDNIYEFKNDENYILDNKNDVIIWKIWCNPYKE